MKIAFTADQHARGKDLKDFSTQWAQLWAICRREGVSHIISCGDLFDCQNIGDKNAETGAIVAAVLEPIVLDLWDRLYRLPESLTFTDPHFHVISGNHDQSAPHRVSAIEVLKSSRSVSVYTELGIHDLGENVKLCTLPWIYGDMNNALYGLQLDLKNTPPEGRKPTHSILVAHAEVMGAALNKLKASDHGIDREHRSLATFGKVVFGHFHKRQQLWPNGGYVGALRQLNHGEEGNPAGFEIYDTETRETEWIELNGAPRYCSTRIHSVEELQAFNPRPDHINRVICTGFIPPRDIATELEAFHRVSVEVEVAKLERIDRGADVGEGAFKNPRSLVGVYDSAQSEQLDEAEMAEVLALYDEVAR